MVRKIGVGRRLLLWWLSAAAAAVAAGGCAATPSTGSYMSAAPYKQSIFGEIARRSAAYDGVARRPVIVVHGFLGSRLKNGLSGENVWGEVRVGEALRGYSDVHLRDMALPMVYGAPLRETPGPVGPDGLLLDFRVRLARLEFIVNGYDRLIETLKAGGYAPDSEPLPPGRKYHTMFLFSYDWRRDIAANAARFDEYVRLCRAYMKRVYRDHYGLDDYDVKFDIVGHSMGGLLARYYLRYGAQDLPDDGTLPVLDWRGAEAVEQLIVVGTPNSGYLDTCVELVNGLYYSPGAAPYPSGIIGTFHTYYQMMPPTATGSVVLAPDRPEPLDLFNPEVWRYYQWGLLDPEQDRYLQLLLPGAATRNERYAIAFDHLEKCLERARRFQTAMQVYAVPPEHVSLLLFLGDSVETSRRAAVDPATGKLKIIEYDSGDGKVLATSARGDARLNREEWTPFELSPERWDVVIHMPGAHMTIVQDNIFRDNVTYYLLAHPRKNEQKMMTQFIDRQESLLP